MDQSKAADKKAAVAEAMKAFAGAWDFVAVKPEGATKNARRLVFKKDGSYAAQDNDGKELWAGTFEIDPTTSPKVWDHRSHDAKKEGKDALGIYELGSDKLRVACVVGRWQGRKWIGKPRPTATKLETADVVIELKRVR
jgi:uncharacterized protein (TIGR03067 family)